MRFCGPKSVWLFLAAAGWLIWTGSGRGDSWGPPTTEFRSGNRQYVFHVSWPYGKKLSLGKVTAGGEEELWSRPYVDETWPPCEAYVTDDGQHVVLRDVYHNLGYGKVLVFLGPKGELLKSYELADLLTQDQILETTHSVSSIWWSEPGWFSFLQEQRQFAFVTYHGAMDCFDVATGDRVALDEKRRAEVRSAALKALLPLLKNGDSSQKTEAAMLCGAMKATEAVPELRQLLQENAPTSGKAAGLTGMFELMGGPNYADVQAAAAKALIAVIQIDAVPLIEEQLACATPATRAVLLGAIASLDGGLYRFHVSKTPDSAFLLATWHRLSKSQFDDVRKIAVRAILTRDEAQYVYDRPELLKDPDQEMRFQAVRCLVERGDQRAIPLLRDALHDNYSPIQTWAFRGLIKFKPDDLDTILREGLKHKDSFIRSEAVEELVRRGDEKAIARVVDHIAGLKDHKHDAKGTGSEHIYTDEWCRLIIEQKLKAAEPALRQAYTNPCEEIRRPVSAALAAFGDQAALKELREFARKGDALGRSASIEMLGLVGDAESLPMLHEMLTEREPWVREAAEEAIATLEEKVKGERGD
jgi:HEAT repeat protein